MRCKFLEQHTWAVEFSGEMGLMAIGQGLFWHCPHNSCTAINCMSLYWTKLHDGHAGVSWHFTVHMDSSWHTTYTGSVTLHNAQGRSTMSIVDTEARVGTLTWDVHRQKEKPVSVWCRSIEYFTSHATWYRTIHYKSLMCNSSPRIQKPKLSSYIHILIFYRFLHTLDDDPGELKFIWVKNMWKQKCSNPFSKPVQLDIRRNQMHPLWERKSRSNMIHHQVKSTDMNFFTKGKDQQQLMGML